MKMKKLIEVHSDTLQLVHCAHCDGESINSRIFYKELENGSFGFQTYLSCCKDKIGSVVDWYSLEDYNKVLNKINVGGHLINNIQGYKK